MENERHEEIPDKTPVELPLGYERPPTIQEIIQRYVRIESRRAEEQGFETFDEANDFEVEEGNEDINFVGHEVQDMEDEYVGRPGDHDNKGVAGRVSEGEERRGGGEPAAVPDPKGSAEARGAGDSAGTRSTVAT